IKVPSKKGDAAYFSLLKEHFSPAHGIERLEVNALTGSVLFTHPYLDIKAVSAYAETARLFKLEDLRKKTVPLSRSVTKAFSDFDKKIQAFTGSELDIPSLAFVALLGLGIYQISRGNFAAPAWYTAFWYAMNIFLKAYSHQSAEG
ncbi:MAG TPA: hypothetical protein VF790_12840, partial [Dissulfurispiraceae bacterium]